MIGKMHDKTNSVAFKFIFALVSLSFVLGGIGSGFLRGDTSAVKVNGEEVSQRTFSEVKRRQESALYNQLGERSYDLLDNPEYVKQFNQSILSTLIDEELLRQYAKELKLGISANQIKSEIVNNPMFHKEGKFDNSLYQQLLRSNNISADQYAATVYEGMLMSQLQEGIVESEFSLPVQQDLLAKLLMQKRTVRLANYSLAKEMENQTASDTELQTYFAAHKEQFINPEKLTVEYVLITPQDLEARIQVTKEQIETYYQTNKAQYMTAGEAKIAHIQVSDPALAEALVQQLNNGADFAALAKEKSTDTLSAAQGGDLGWARAGTFPKAFENAFVNLKAGQISTPVKVDGAYHIIKVLDRKAEKVIPVEQLQDQISQIIRTELAAVEYSNVAREMANRAFENTASLEPVAEAGGVKVQKTAAFSRDNVPAVLSDEKVLKVLFEGDLRQSGQNSEAIPVSETETLFVRVSDYQAQNNQTFEQAKAAVEREVKREKAEQALHRKATEVVKALQAGDLQAVTFEQPQTLVFAEAQANEPVLTQAIFAMAKPEGASRYQYAVNGNGDVVVIALDKVENGESKAFQVLAPQFNQLDRLSLHTTLINDLRDRAKIEFNEAFMEQINNVER